MESEIAAQAWDSALWLTLVAVLALLCLSAFFSGSETALTAASRGKLHGLADRGNRGADTALKLTEDNERLIGAILLGNNLVNILATSLATSTLTLIFGDSGVALATLVMTALVLVFAEVMPKTYAISNPEAAATRVSPIIAIVVRVLAPIVNIVRALVRTFLRLFGVETDPEANLLAAQEEIAGAINLHHSEGAVEKDDKDRLL
ncbi:MAG: CNNM domain-containing protein, partial [Pseudomonadota bacterium]